MRAYAGMNVQKVQKVQC